MNRTSLFLGLAGLAALGAGTWYFAHPGNLPGVGAGQPLPSSTTQIKVLEEAQPVATAEEPSTSISISTPQPARPVPPAVFDKTAARLGTTLSLLLSTWQQGGPLPRQLAADAATLAEETGQPALEDAAAALRTATPREGPTTLNVLLVGIAQALTLPPPEDLPADDAAAEAQKSWLRKELENLVNIRSTPQTQNRWSTALSTVQMMFARGLVADGVATLNATPLVGDTRLDALRVDARTYLSQTGKLNNLITAYTSTFTINAEGE